MSKSFAGVTHSIVRTVKSTDDMKAMNGIMAFVDICFGPGDDNSIRPVAVKKAEGPVTMVTASVPKTMVIADGKKIWTPTISGKVADEAKLLALQAFDRVKQAYGLKFNKTYRVLAKTVEEVQSPAAINEGSQ